MSLLTLALAVLAQAAPAPAAPAPAPAATAQATRFNLDTPVEQLVAEPRAKAVLDARVPELTTHALYNMFKAMSLRELAPRSGGRLPPELMTQIETDLSAIR
jgi:hypothetical protein